MRFSLAIVFQLNLDKFSRDLSNNIYTIIKGIILFFSFIYLTFVEPSAVLNTHFFKILQI